MFAMTTYVPVKLRCGAFANLCDEEVFEIFKFLPLRDRKNARLVCKQWNAVLSRKVFAEKEILCVPNWYSFSSVGQILNKNSTKKLALKFVCQNFDASSKSLWKTLGNKIKSLHFDWCTFDSEGLLFIFYYCVYLNEFSARNSSFSTKPGWIFIISKKSGLATFLFGNKMTRANLQKLHFDSGTSSACFKERDLFVIASLFPKLKTLEIQLMLLYDDSKMKAFIPRSHISLSKLKHIETFDIELHLPHPSLQQYYQYIKFLKVCNVDFSSMKNFRMNLNNFYLRVETLDRILSHKYWASLVLFEINLHPNTNVTVIADLLDKLPSLKKFKICLTMQTDGEIDHQTMNILFPALVKSRLTNLHIEISNSTCPTDDCISSIYSSWDDSFVNYTVRYLFIIANGLCNSKFSSLFVKHFLGIVELYTDLGDPNIIFQHQKYLQSLILHVEDDLRIGNETLLLSSLKVIKMFNFQPIHWILFERNRFSNVTHLLISSYKGFDDENAQESQNDSIEKFESLLSSLPSSCPNVEVFEFCWESHPDGLRGAQLPGILQLCQQFRKLRYLSLKINYKECLQSKKLLKKALITNFEQCSSLRAVWLQLCCINLLSFINIMTKKCEFCEGNFTFVPELYAHSWMFK